MKNYILIVILTIIGLSEAIAQTPAPVQDFTKNPRVYTQRRSFWFEANIAGTLKRNDSGKAILQYQIDWQYRRAGDANFINGGTQNNIFKEVQQHVFRPWLHFWAIPGKVRLSISPIGQWGTWAPKAEGSPRQYYTEYRSSYQMSLFQKIGKIDIQQRYRYEFRWVGSNQAAKESISDLTSSDKFLSTGHKMRLRYLMRANYPLVKSGKSYLSLWDEVFIGMGKHVANNKIFDQNRVVALFGRKLNSSKYPMKLEVGLMWQLVPRYNIDVPATQPISYGTYAKNNWESNLALQIYLVFDEFHKFKHK